LNDGLFWPQMAVHETAIAITIVAALWKMVLIIIVL
jgi:hypothetical protein